MRKAKEQYNDELAATKRLVCSSTMLSALIVVSSIDAAVNASSVDPPSHIPANAAILLHTTQHVTDVIVDQHTNCRTQLHMTSPLTHTRMTQRKDCARVISMRIVSVYKLVHYVFAYLAARRYMTRSPSSTAVGFQIRSSHASQRSGIDVGPT